MKGLTAIFVLAACCAGCGSSMDATPVLQPGSFSERLVDDRGGERPGVDFVATAQRDPAR